MQGAGWGRIVNIAARSGLVGVSRAAQYGAAKAAIIGLTASLAKELGPNGILVNAVAPTQLLTVKDGSPSIPDDKAAELAKAIPLRRVASSGRPGVARGLARIGGEHVRDRRDDLAPRRRPALTRRVRCRAQRRGSRSAQDDLDDLGAADDLDGEPFARGRSSRATRRSTSPPFAPSACAVELDPPGAALDDEAERARPPGRSTAAS